MRLQPDDHGISVQRRRLGFFHESPTISALQKQCLAPKRDEGGSSKAEFEAREQGAMRL
jgi:hypothetical protein